MKQISKLKAIKPSEMDANTRKFLHEMREVGCAAMAEFIIKNGGKVLENSNIKFEAESSNGGRYLIEWDEFAFRY